MCFSKPAKPDIPDPQPVQAAPTAQDPVVAAAATEAVRRNRSAAGAQSTILTPGRNAAGATALTGRDESVPLLGKTILGQ